MPWFLQAFWRKTFHAKLAGPPSAWKPLPGLLRGGYDPESHGNFSKLGFQKLTGDYTQKHMAGYIRLSIYIYIYIGITELTLQKASLTYQKLGGGLGSMLNYGLKFTIG